MMPAPAPAGRQRVGQDATGQRDDQAALLGERDEQVRRDRAVRRMAPAGQCFDADDLAGRSA